MEDNVLAILEHWGLKADKIEEDNLDKSPDFLVEDNQHIHLIELKTREDREGRRQAQHSAFDLGELFTETLPIVRKNTLSGIVRDASNQLSARDEYKVDFRIVWLMAVDAHQEAKIEQMEASLYGQVGLADIDSGIRKQCYFYSHSDFFRFRAVLDAAILSWEGSAKLCLNPHSPRYQEIKSTGLYSIFGEKAVDPIWFEKSDKAYIVDSDIDRNDETAVLEYVKSKYGKNNLMRLDIGLTAVSLAVDDE